MYGYILELDWIIRVNFYALITTKCALNINGFIHKIEEWSVLVTNINNVMETGPLLGKIF